MMTAHLGGQDMPSPMIQSIEVEELLDAMASFYRDVLTKKGRSGESSGITFQRVAFFFHANTTEVGRVQNLTIIKPDEYRYWTRSQAMRDAGELASAIVDAATGMEKT
jgi:hypothetical protein